MKLTTKIIILFSLLLSGCDDDLSPKSQSTGLFATSNLKNNSATYQDMTFKSLKGYRILQRRPSSGINADDDSLIDMQIPKEIKDLNGTNIEITGYAFPIELEAGKSKSLVLMSVLPSCCFGDSLKLNDMIYIDASKDLKEIKNQQSVHVKGKLSVGMQEVSGWGSKFIYVLVADEVRVETTK